MLNKKIKMAMIFTVILFLIGHLLIFLGLAYGERIASTLSRPWGATSWTISSELINGCTVVLVTMGGCFVLISLVASIFFLRAYFNFLFANILNNRK